eukprot:15221-Heterococcus_DN1.PRE.5
MHLGSAELQQTLATENDETCDSRLERLSAHTVFAAKLSLMARACVSSWFTSLRQRNHLCNWCRYSEHCSKLSSFEFRVSDRLFTSHNATVPQHSTR